MGDISRNFHRSEFACKCGCGFDDINLRLVEFCQEIRDRSGEPLKINSGCRCVIHNKSVGGVYNSYHLRGFAVDIGSRTSVIKLLKIIEVLYSGGLWPFIRWKHYINRNFIHIDTGRKP